MNTSLEGAVPFMAQARQQGFWTPADIMRNATMTRATAAVTGMSTAQVQNMTAYGAQMSRAVGGTGQQGARGMDRSLQMAGAMVGGAYANYMLERIPSDDLPAHLAWYNIILNFSILASSLGGPAIAGQIGLAPALILFAVLRIIAGAAILKWG